VERFQCLDRVSIEINSRFVQTADSFFASWTVANFSRRAPLYGIRLVATELNRCRILILASSPTNELEMVL
jgi:hypothetical protein